MWFKYLDAAQGGFRADRKRLRQAPAKGRASEQKANRAYDRKMAGLFAANGHGPSHLGKSITLEGDAEFENVGTVYYPGLDYFTSLMQSTFYNGIVGGKQLGDTQAIPTVPILDRL